MSKDVSEEYASLLKDQHAISVALESQREDERERKRLKVVCFVSGFATALVVAAGLLVWGAWCS